MAKITIAQSFHRFVAQPNGPDGKPRKELREDFPAGKTVEVSEEDAADFIAKGLANEPARAGYESTAG